MKANSAKTDLSRQISRIRNETKIFTNIHIILDKAEQDGYFETLFGTFSRIFDLEVHFALKGSLTRTPQNRVDEASVQSPQPTRQQHLYFQGKHQTHHHQNKFP